MPPADKVLAPGVMLIISGLPGRTGELMVKLMSVRSVYAFNLISEVREIVFALLGGDGLGESGQLGPEASLTHVRTLFHDICEFAPDFYIAVHGIDAKVLLDENASDLPQSDPLP